MIAQILCLEKSLFMTADKQLIYLLQGEFSLKENSFKDQISVSLEHSFLSWSLIVLVTCGIFCDQEKIVQEIKHCLYNPTLRGCSGFKTGELPFISVK